MSFGAVLVPFVSEEHHHVRSFYSAFEVLDATRFHPVVVVGKHHLVFEVLGGTQFASHGVLALSMQHHPVFEVLSVTRLGLDGVHARVVVVGRHHLASEVLGATRLGSNSFLALVTVVKLVLFFLLAFEVPDEIFHGWDLDVFQETLSFS